MGIALEARNDGTRGRLKTFDLHMRSLRAAGELASVLDLGRALCVVYRDAIQHGNPGVDWQRARRMAGDPAISAGLPGSVGDTDLLVRVIERGVLAAAAADYRGRLTWLATMWQDDRGRTVRFCRLALAMYAAATLGRLNTCVCIVQAEIIAGVRDRDTGELVEGWG